MFHSQDLFIPLLWQLHTYFLMSSLHFNLVIQKPVCLEKLSWSFPTFKFYPTIPSGALRQISPVPVVISAQNTRLHPPRTLSQNIRSSSLFVHLPSDSHMYQSFHTIFSKIGTSLFYLLYFLKSCFTHPLSCLLSSMRIGFLSLYRTTHQ